MSTICIYQDVKKCLFSRRPPIGRHKEDQYILCVATGVFIRQMRGRNVNQLLLHHWKPLNIAKLLRFRSTRFVLSHCYRYFSIYTRCSSRSNGHNDPYGELAHSKLADTRQAKETHRFVVTPRDISIKPESKMQMLISSVGTTANQFTQAFQSTLALAVIYIVTITVWAVYFGNIFLSAMFIV